MLKRAKRKELEIGDAVKVLWPTEDGRKAYISGQVLWVPDAFTHWPILIEIGFKNGKILALEIPVSRVYVEK